MEEAGVVEAWKTERGPALGRAETGGCIDKVEYDVDVCGEGVMGERAQLQLLCIIVYVLEVVSYPRHQYARTRRGSGNIVYNELF